LEDGEHVGKRRKRNVLARELSGKRELKQSVYVMMQKKVSVSKYSVHHAASLCELSLTGLMGHVACKFTLPSMLI
jgi:hypothetical protein